MLCDSTFKAHALILAYFILASRCEKKWREHSIVPKLVTKKLAVEFKHILSEPWCLFTSMWLKRYL